MGNALNNKTNPWIRMSVFLGRISFLEPFASILFFVSLFSPHTIASQVSNGLRFCSGNVQISCRIQSPPKFRHDASAVNRRPREKCHTPKTKRSCYTILSIRMNGQRQNKRHFGVGCRTMADGGDFYFHSSFRLDPLCFHFVFGSTNLKRSQNHTHTHRTHHPHRQRQQWNNLYRFSSFCVFYFENVIIFSALGLLAYCLDVLGRSTFFFPPQMHHVVAAAISDYTLSFVRKFISSAFIPNTRLIRCQREWRKWNYYFNLIPIVWMESSVRFCRRNRTKRKKYLIRLYIVCRIRAF